MDVPPSPDRVFDFPMAEPEPHPAYDFFAAEPIPGLVEAPGNMNGWIKEDVPLLGKMGEPMEIAGGAEEAGLDLLFGDYTNDDDDDEVIENLCVRMGNLEYGNEALVKKMGTVSDAQVADSIVVGEIWPRVTTVEGQVQVMASQAVQVMSRLEEIETTVHQVESRVNTHPSGIVTGQGQDVIVGLSQQVQTLQTSLHGAELQNQQLQTSVAEMESCKSTLMSYMLWMEERLAVLEKKLPGPPPGPQ
ncbi:hypothetical protein Tco_1510414 [Tanacetum coccineum]